MFQKLFDQRYKILRIYQNPAPGTFLPVNQLKIRN